MKCLLDTCSYYWLVDDQKQLSPAARKEIGDTTNSLHVSAITLTELHRLIRKGKISIRAPNGLDEWFHKGLAHHQIVCEPITLEIAQRAETLPVIHNDPADRWIIATAQTLGAKILSPDTVMAKYPNTDVVW
jgi:PIN domain nuclease of toxin-antitoxin system